MFIFALLLGVAGVGAAGVAWYQARTPDEPAAPGTSGPPPAAGTEPPPCSRLLELVRSQGSAAGEAAFFREIQHAAGQQGYRSGGWVGAIVGAVTGAGAGSSRVKECKKELGAAYDEARDAHRATRHQIRDEFKACKDKCKATFPHHGLGPHGKPYRDCVAGCRQVRHDERRAMHGPDNPGATWLRTFMP
jgi:hypothetical protein